MTAQRHLISGGPPASVWECYARAAGPSREDLPPTMPAVRRDRLCTLKRLHPVLKI